MIEKERKKERKKKDRQCLIKEKFACFLVKSRKFSSYKTLLYNILTYWRPLKEKNHKDPKYRFWPISYNLDLRNVKKVFFQQGDTAIHYVYCT
jgi:hypothetical protein